jgi:hypothetical protein
MATKKLASMPGPTSRAASETRYQHIHVRSGSAIHGLTRSRLPPWQSGPSD